MKRLPQLFGLGLLGLALLVSAGPSQDAKKDDKDKKGEEKKKKTNLPQGFKDLNLTAEQKTKIYNIMGEYSSKIAELDKQIKALKKQEFQDLTQVLTQEQKDKYLQSKGFDAKKDKDKKDKDKS